MIVSLIVSCASSLLRIRKYGAIFGSMKRGVLSALVLVAVGLFSLASAGVDVDPGKPIPWKLAGGEVDPGKPIPWKLAGAEVDPGKPIPWKLANGCDPGKPIPWKNVG